MTITYRDEVDHDLNAPEIDANFRAVVAMIQDVIDNPPAAANISAVTQSGRVVTFHYSSGDTFDITLPIIMPAWRGAWTPATMYAAFDMFYVEVEGLFVVLEPHVSASTFDATESDTSGDFYQQILGPFASATTLSDLLDLGTAGTPSAGDVPQFDGAEWVNKALGALGLVFADITDVTLPYQRHNAPVTLGSTGTQWIDCTAADVFLITPGGDITLGVSVVEAGAVFSLIVTTSGTTDRTLTFNTGASFKSTGTLATGIVSGKKFTVSFACDGVDCVEIGRTGPI